jgi:2-polyprenyl-6-methoxyphenol hydroxylase-like FAD-dependent oxidoreductase
MHASARRCLAHFVRDFKACRRLRMPRRHGGISAVPSVLWSEQICEAAYLAGCDGAHSTVRQTLAVDFAGGTYSPQGYWCLRLIGPVSWDADREQCDLTFDDVGKRAVGNLKLTIAKLNWFSTYRVHHRVERESLRHRPDSPSTRWHRERQSAESGRWCCMSAIQHPGAESRTQRIRVPRLF